MPASVSSSTVCPSASAASRAGGRDRSTDWWKVTTRPVSVTSRSAASRCSRRVSSTARTSADSMVARSRGPTSPGRPSGAPPSTSRPVTSRSLSRWRRPPIHLPWRHGGAGGDSGTGRPPAAPAAAAPPGSLPAPPPPPPPAGSLPALAPPPPPPRGDAAPSGRPPALVGAGRRAGRRQPGEPALGHLLSARQTVRRGLLPARGARAADLGTRVQPRLLVHRPPAARQVDDRDRRAAVRVQLLRLASPVRGGGHGGRRRPHPADAPAHRVDTARAGRGAAAGPRRLLLLDLPGRAARRLPAGVRRGRRRVPRRRPRPRSRTHPDRGRGRGRGLPAPAP